MKYYKLAIDGPAGAGKSSVAKMVARRLHYTYIDTGAMYRAITYKAMKLNLDLADPNQFGFLDETEMKFIDGILYLDGKNITVPIRSNEVNNNVSVVASHVPVRNKLVSLQQMIAKNSNVVMDGRDIGTIVLPDADLKIYMSATVEERARRRHEENRTLGIKSDYQALIEEIKRRDLFDSSRNYNPLRKAEDAVFLDTSKMDINEVADKIYEMFMDILKTKRSE
ncbi:MAG: (d)CMP kinase [Firmicutes bacterium]|nr:(d)CMP kinase [Bacillota bacterium]